MKYDYLIVGSGLFASVFANEALKRGKKCLVIEKRNEAGGNIYCEKIKDIIVHKYGAHIFHTSNEEVWEYVNKFAKFNRYTNSPVANFKGEIYNLPFNMNTFNKLWGVITPEQAKEKIEEQKADFKAEEITNLEEQAISLVGKDIYEKLIKGYTEKQWGRECCSLPSFIIKRLPLRFTYDNNYFNDLYQGIPIGGYNTIIEKLLDGTEVKVNEDFFSKKEYYADIAEKIVYTGKIDEFYNYQFGKLEYRSLRFETEVLNIENYQGNAVVNYTEKEVPYTRIIEHKHFEYGTQADTVITREYPIEWQDGMDPYYPINDDKNQDRCNLYKKLAEKESNIIFGGRLAEYKYYDMDKVIESALRAVKKEFSE